MAVTRQLFPVTTADLARDLEEGAVLGLYEAAAVASNVTPSAAQARKGIQKGRSASRRKAIRQLRPSPRQLRDREHALWQATGAHVVGVLYPTKGPGKRIWTKNPHRKSLSYQQICTLLGKDDGIETLHLRPATRVSTRPKPFLADLLVGRAQAELMKEPLNQRAMTACAKALSPDYRIHGPVLFLIDT